jgi:acetolactate synthase small subunit
MDGVLLLRVRDRPGALERVLGAIRRKVLPVRRLSLHEPDGGARDVVLRFDAGRIGADRMLAELGALYDVEDACAITGPDDPATREMALVHLRGGDRPGPGAPGRVVRHGPDGVVVELTGTPAEIDGIIGRLRATGGVAAAVRTGEVVVPAVDGGSTASAGAAPTDGNERTETEEGS